MRVGRSTALVVLGALLLGSSAVAAVSTGETSLPGAAGFPESIAVQPGTGTFFVSSFVTGAVYRGTAGQEGRLFLPGGASGRASAAGVKFDGPGRLMVISGSSPAALQELQIFSSQTGRHEATFNAAPSATTNLNDMALASNGNVYITNFASPAIYRVTAQELKRGSGPISRWLSAPTQVVPDLPASSDFNGIAATADGRYLIVGQSGNGALWRVDIAKRVISRIAVNGGSLIGSDGILLLGRTVYVATHQNAVFELALRQTYATARVLKRLADPSLDLPTSVTVADNRLLVSNGSKPAAATDYQITSFPIPRSGDEP